MSGAARAGVSSWSWSRISKAADAASTGGRHSLSLVAFAVANCQVLQSCDVILYDRLAQEAQLKLRFCTKLPGIVLHDF